MKKYFSAMVVMIITLVLSVAASYAATRGQTIFYEDFDSGPNSHYTSTQWASLPKDTSFNGTWAYRSQVSGTTAGTSWQWLNLSSSEINEARGGRLRYSVMAKATGVTAGSLKVMMIVTSPTQGTTYPAATTSTNTFDWQRMQCMIAVPQDASALTVVVGIQNGNGTALFDDARVEIARPWRKRVTTTASATRYNSHPDVPRLRGSGVGSGLALWPNGSGLYALGTTNKANVARIMLDSLSANSASFTGATFDSWLDSQFNRLDNFILQAQANRVKVLIDLHPAPGGYDATYNSSRIFMEQKYQDDLVRGWQTIATRYKDNPVVWGYDLVNEPIDSAAPLSPNFPAPGTTWLQGWNELAGRVGQAIRQIDTTHALIVEAELNDQPTGFHFLTPLTDPATGNAINGVVYSVHIYQPMNYTHQGVMAQYPNGVNLPSNISQILSDTVQPVVDFESDYNVPIFVGEFSAVRWAQGAASYLTSAINLFESKGWDWSYHAFRTAPEWDLEKPDSLDGVTTTPTDGQRLSAVQTGWNLNQKPVMPFGLKPLHATGSRLEATASGSAGTGITLNAKSTNLNQKWNLMDLGTRYYKLWPAYNTALRLEVPLANNANNTQLKLNTGTVGWEQEWSYTVNSNGSYSFKPRYTPRVISAQGGGSSNGTPIVIYDDSSATSQHWMLSLN